MTFLYYFDMYVVYVSIRYGLKFFFEDFILYLFVINVHCSLMFSLKKKEWCLIAKMAEKREPDNFRQSEKKPFRCDTTPNFRQSEKKPFRCDTTPNASSYDRLT